MELIGRDKERTELDRLYNSGRAEFVAIYGRRRVGKTYLVDECFNGKICFKHTGLSPFDKKVVHPTRKQLHSFYLSLKHFGLKGEPCPTNWLDAFFLLEKLLEEKDNGERQLIFIDELPWMDTPRGGFIPAFEQFWNGWAAGRKNIMLVVCGSASSWIMDKLINAKGGLYDRLTSAIHLHPFSLGLCEKYFKALGCELKQHEVLQAYMVMGGIPYYMNYWRPDLSLPQNIDNIFFSREARLKGEFERLFGSLFTNPEAYLRIIRLLGTKHSGFTIDEICQALNIQKGGTLSDMLLALEESDFITKYHPFGEKKNIRVYKLTDNYCWFYLHFIDKAKTIDYEFWQNYHHSSQLNAWRGIAFEEICLQHIEQIKFSLGISGVRTSESSWVEHGEDGNRGAQIDLIIDRSDDVVSLCEMKYSQDDYSLQLDEEEKIHHRISKVNEHLTRKQSLHVVLVTTYALKHNSHSSVFRKVITMDDLFR